MKDGENVYVKRFDEWHPIKKEVDLKEPMRFFKEREIWYCNMGCNIGYEQDGKNEDFERPVVILKKCDNNLFVGIPLTTKIKSFSFYFDVGVVEECPAMAILLQTRTFSSKRLVNKLETMDKEIFEEMKKATRKYIFGD